VLLLVLSVPLAGGGIDEDTAEDKDEESPCREFFAAHEEENAPIAHGGRKAPTSSVFQATAASMQRICTVGRNRRLAVIFLEYSFDGSIVCA